jgi:drug/metabolite transporter (DMT)-like permease
MTPFPAHPALNASTVGVIVIMVLGATIGETMMSAAMKSFDLDAIRAKSGLPGAIKAVVSSPLLIAAIFFMSVSFFALLFALSGADLSLVAPATNSLTFIATAIAAKFYLKENVDKRRWLAAIFVAAGVVLLAL